MVLAGLLIGTKNSSNTFFTLLGLDAKILKVPGAAISPIAKLAEPVPLALPSQRPANMASMICAAAANFKGSTSKPASLKKPFSTAA